MLRTNFDGDPNIGLYGFATDGYCALGLNSEKARLEKELDVDAHVITILNTGLVGIFASGNSRGLILPAIMEKHEREKVKVKTLYLKSRFTALGNLVLMNDKGIILSPLLGREKREIEQFFGLRCEMTSIAGTAIVGKAGIATNKGCLVHPKTKRREISLIEDVLQVKCDIGTVNFGSPYPGSGVIANTSGVVASQQSSGPELGRIVEALGFL